MDIEQKFYIGVVVATVNNNPSKLTELDNFTRESKVVLVDIPGNIQTVLAYPKSTSLDEPKVGDQLLLLCLDPEYHSYYIYDKLKENDFIGFRSSGKMVSITPDHITVGVFDRGKEYKDDEEPSCKAKLTIKSDGTVYIHSTSGLVINTDDGHEISFEDNGQLNISGTQVSVYSNESESTQEDLVDGNGDPITVKDDSGNTVTGDDGKPVTVKAGATININGNPDTTCANGTGAFCSIPYCPFTGLPHLSPLFRMNN